MSPINDSYGDAPEAVDDFIEDANAWLRGVARGLLPVDDERYEDVVQEGRIALWRAYREMADQPERIGACLYRAKLRMKEMTFHQGKPTSTESKRPTYEVKKAFSKDAIEDGWESLLWGCDPLAGVELAYHHGEIHDAIAALTPYQQKYIYARFWCGMDPADGLHSNPGMREARNANPFLRRDILWTGSKATPGAKKKLLGRLSHLAGVV